LENTLKERINTIDIGVVKDDILNFVNAETRKEIDRLEKAVLTSAVDTFHKNCLKRDREKSRDDDLNR
jgi:hypothetical protein